MGKAPTAEHREKLSSALRGREKTAAHRENIAAAKRGEKNPQWGGGRFIDKAGYVYLWSPDHPMAQKSGYVLEHRAVMAGLVGRPLMVDETVHHINGDKSDNRPENLQLRKGRHGKGAAFMCGDCGSINILSLGL